MEQLPHEAASCLVCRVLGALYRRALVERRGERQEPLLARRQAVHDPRELVHNRCRVRSLAGPVLLHVAEEGL